MKFVDEFRDKQLVSSLAKAIDREARRSWRLMEVCGGQTHSIMKYGIAELLPKNVELLHGPGCPVCVTPVAWIDKAIEIARTPGAILASFGDMLRVPGSGSDLLRSKAQGADVRIVYSPLDALTLAEQNPYREVVFFGVGFETTAPATAALLLQARERNILNLSLLVCHVLVPPALRALLDSPDCRIDGFLAAGHVCTVMGYEEYLPIAAHYQVPIVVTGFEPVDILEGILSCVRQLESGRHEVENQYARVVSRQGNRQAQLSLKEVFRSTTRSWRGLGEIPESGLTLTSAFARFDAEDRFGPVLPFDEVSTGCISGLVLQGLKKPPECPAFGKECRPEAPLGAPMVSTEGACSAYFRYQKREGLHG